MQISLNVREISPDEATGLVVLLITIFGDTILPATSPPSDDTRHLHTQDEGTRETPQPVVLQVAHDADGAPFLEPSQVFGAAPTAGVIPTPPPAHVGGAVELDVHGLPWDARIHSSTKALNKDKTWRFKKNLDETSKAAVTAELRQIMGAPAVTAPSPPAPEPTIAQALAVVPPPPAADPAPAPAPPAAPVAPAPPPPAVAPTADFVGMMTRLTPLQAANPEKLATPIVVGFVQQLGLTQISDLLKRPDLIPSFEMLVNSAVA